MTPEKGLIVVEEAKKYINKEYDNWANAKFAIPLLFMLIRRIAGMDFNYEKYNCIGYVISAMRMAGLKLGWILEPENITPGMEYLDPILLNINEEGNMIGSVVQTYNTPSFVAKALK